MSRLLAASVVLHAVFLVAVAYIPTVQSMLNVAGSLAGVKFVYEDYDKTLIGQRATIINIKEQPYQKLYYPADYFGAPPAPEQLSPTDPAFVAEVRPQPAPVISRPRRIPRARTTPTPEPSPTPEATPEVAKNSDGEPLSAEDAAKAEAEMNKVAQETGVKRPSKLPNLKPLMDVLKLAKEMKEDGRINLNATVELIAEADLKEDGTLENLTFPEENGDANLRALAGRFMDALNVGKVLSFLDVKHLKLSIKIDQQNVFVGIVTEAETPGRATELANGYGGLIGLAKLAKKGKDEAKVFENMKVKPDGKQVIMEFQMPRDMAGELLGKVKDEG